MKKMLKKILISGVICLAIVVIIFIWYFNNQSIKVTIVKEAYNMLAKDDNESLNVKLLVNQKNSYITNIDKINSCYLHSYDGDYYQLSVKDIKLVNQTSINKDNYYIYEYALSFKVKLDIDLIIKEAYLVLNYNNSKSLDIFIGSVSIYNKGNDDNDEISIGCMKAITKRIENVIAIEGIVFRFNVKNNIRITKIECLDCHLHTQNAYTCEYEKVKSEDDLNNIFLSSYNYKNINENNYNIEAMGNTEIVIRVGYDSLLEIDSFPLMIEYISNGKVKRMYIDKFTFFVNNERSVKISDLTIYEFEYN